jgi:starvation-inducible outer membrane lipoprotein
MRILAIALALAGCAASPQHMAQQSNWDVCRFTMGGPHQQVAEQERRNRGLDCAPYYPAIQQRLANESAATYNMQRALQPAPQQAPPQPIVCQSNRAGNSVQTVCN